MDVSRIKVFQYMYGNQEHFQWSEKVNRTYCDRHGYRYEISRETPRKDRHVNWHKIVVLSHAFHDAEYVLYLDADAVFYSHELKIEDELLPLLSGKKILMAQDVGCETQRWHEGQPNAGVILLESDPEIPLVMNDWNNSSESHEESKWRWPLEQLTLWKFIIPRYQHLFHVHSEYYQIQGLYGQYIRHFMLMSDTARTEKIKEIHSRLGI